jgi:hypothetical protein
MTILPNKLDGIIADSVHLANSRIWRGSRLKRVRIVTQSIALGARAGSPDIPQRVLAVMTVGPVNHQLPGFPVKLDNRVSALHAILLGRITELCPKA